MQIAAALLIIANLLLLLGSLREHDNQRYGTFDLLVVCDHNPEGVRLEGLSRHALWLTLARLDPDHHLVWVNNQPLFSWKRGRS